MLYCLVSGSNIIGVGVYGKLGQIFHNFNIFEICQLAGCTKVELIHLVKQAPKIPAGDFELALQDAKSVMDILAFENEQKAKEPTALNTWNSWGGLTQVSNLLRIFLVHLQSFSSWVLSTPLSLKNKWWQKAEIKENGQKIANFMETISPKRVTASFFGGQPRQGMELVFMS